MKKPGKILRWMLISIALQLIVLSFFDFIYLPGRGKVTLSVFTEFDPIEDREFKVPGDARNIKVSYNGSYAGYIRGSRIVILETSRGRKVKTIECGGNGNISFRWLPDRNILIYAAESAGYDGPALEVITLDMENDLLRSYPPIKDLPENSFVSDIQLSTITNVVYVKVDTGDLNAQIYKYDIMDALSFVMKTGSDTVIRETVYADQLVYQDKSNKIMIHDGKGRTVLPFEEEAVLLGIDSEDVIYAGKLGVDGRVTQVCFGKVENLLEGKWEKYDPAGGIARESIFIHPTEGIFIRNESGSRLQMAGSTSGGIVLDGELIELHDRFIVTRAGNRVKVKVFPWYGDASQKDEGAASDIVDN